MRNKIINFASEMSMDEKTIKETLRRGEQVTPFANGQRQRCRSRFGLPIRLSQ